MKQPKQVSDTNMQRRANRSEHMLYFERDPSKTDYRTTTRSSCRILTPSSTQVVWQKAMPPRSSWRVSTKFAVSEQWRNNRNPESRPGGTEHCARSSNDGKKAGKTATARCTVISNPYAQRGFGKDCWNGLRRSPTIVNSFNGQNGKSMK